MTCSVSAMIGYPSVQDGAIPQEDFSFPRFLNWSINSKNKSLKSIYISFF